MQKPSIGSVLKTEGLFAKKSLGQHFLLDINLTSKIARLANIGENDIIFEIGPGPGGLTQALLQSLAKRVIVIEKDRRFAEHLRNYFAEYKERLIVIEADALKTNLYELMTQYANSVSAEILHPKIISNLPYNVGTQLFINWLSGVTKDWPMVLMFQLEVAKRICAKPGEKEYGRLAILTDAICNSRIAMSVPRLAFTPPPKVESAIVCIDYKAQKFVNITALEKITAAAFGQRRKMLRSSLASICDATVVLNNAGVDGTLRAEALNTEQFYKLADAYSLLIDKN